jgi:lipoprotein NlpI
MSRLDGKRACPGRLNYALDDEQEPSRNAQILDAVDFELGGNMSHTRLGFSGALVAIMIFQISPAAADKCDDLREPEPRIVACTQSIKSGKWKGDNQAINYGNRGKAYEDKGDFDRAIVEYNQAISINPRNPTFYNNRGIAYRGKGDLDRAIADYSQAISLNPKDHDAYYNRGIAYRNKGDLDHAIADYSQAISLNAKDPDFFNNRAFAYREKGDFDRSIADYSEAIRLAPKNDVFYARRGRAYLYNGNLAKALADMSQATELDPTDADEALWLDIVSQRNGVPSRLSQATSKINMSEWPAPVIRLYLGQLTPAALLAAADDPDAAKKKKQFCKANFYSAELSLSKGSKDEAIRLFRLAASDCRHDVVEWSSANSELKALGEAVRVGQ